ncbi:MAG: hypothetical protein KGZ75_13180 [Syntrophomonadaceae bacterium]|nr:hypothetical protein [Syntrophomonadaceae bacterium]
MKWPYPLAACGIGSLPYQEPEQAIELIARYLPEIPHWPQLPKRGHQEHFINQNLFILKKIALLAEENGSSPRMDPEAPGWVDGIVEFYDIYLAASEGDEKALQSFATPEEAAVGFYNFLAAMADRDQRKPLMVKTQIAGPLSVGLNIYDPKRIPVYYHHQLRDIILKTLSMQIKWQVSELQKLGLPVLIFVDDPAVSSYGASVYIALSKEQIIEDLKEIIQVIEALGVIPGVHCCAGADWSIFIEAGFRVISFDAYNYFDSLLPYIAEINAFLEQGGVLAWGLVPTTEDALRESPQSLKGFFEDKITHLTKKGVDQLRLYQQSLVTPACGLGTLDPGLAEHIYQVNLELSNLLRRSFPG